MKIRGLIFDLDGTLLNTLSDIADSMNNVLHNNGFPLHDIQEYRYFVGSGMDVLVQKSLPREIVDKQIVGKCISELKKEYSTRWNVKTSEYHGVTPVLSQLKNTGHSLSVLSNKIHDFTVEMVRYYFDPALFNCVIGAGQFAKKPDPQAAVYIADYSGLDVSEIVYVGDSGIDMKTALAAGMLSAGALWGFRDKSELEQAGANYLLEKPEDILTLLRQIE